MKTQKERDEGLLKKLWKYSPSLAENLREGIEKRRKSDDYQTQKRNVLQLK